MNIPDGVYSALIAVFAAAIGYAVREYRNRVSPLFEMIKIVGDVSKRAESSRVDKDIVEGLRDSFQVGILNPESTLGEIHDAWERCEEIKAYWPDVKKGFGRFFNSTTISDQIAALSHIHSLNYFEKWLIRLMINNKVDFRIDNNVVNSKQLIKTWIEETDDKKAWLDFPGGAQSFGIRFDNPAIRDKLEPYVISVGKLNIDSIKNALNEYVEIFEREYNSALKFSGNLKEIVEQNSRWVFRCFFANTSNSPLIIKNKAKIIIRDKKTKYKYNEECYIATIKESGSDYEDAEASLIVKGGEGVYFVCITSKIQKEMELGKSIRELYDRKDGTVNIEIYMRRQGLLKKQTHKTAPYLFATK